MDTRTVSYILLVSCIIIILITINQSLVENNISNTNLHIGREQFLPIIWDTCNTQRPLGIRNAGLAPGAIYDGMPIHRIGPAINFHQSFKPFLPEMGWRSIFLKNYSDYQVPPDTNFNGTVIRNYLDNLENVDNIYRKCQ